MNRISQYFGEFSDGIGRSWNRFWYSPADPLPLGILRIAVGLLGIYYLYSHTADLIRWFGPRGLLPIESVRVLVAGMSDTERIFRPSYLNLTDAPELLWVMHALGFVPLLAMTLGFCTRLSTFLSLVVVLSYVHRAPLIALQLEPVLTLLLCYLCVGPAGDTLSFDRFLFGRKTRFGALRGEPSWGANLSLRLIQVHLAGFYFMMGLTKLAGEPWWNGTAVWWLIAHADSRMIDLTWMGRHPFPYLINLWTHAIVLFELAFGVFIWNRLGRPLLLIVSVPMWLLLALVSGQLAFCAAMLVANLAFVPASFWHELLGAGSVESTPAKAA